MMLLRHDKLHDQKLFPRRTVDLMTDMEATRYRPERLKAYIHYGLMAAGHICTRPAIGPCSGANLR